MNKKDQLKIIVFMVFGIVGVAILPILNIYYFKNVTVKELFHRDCSSTKLFSSDGLEGIFNNVLLNLGLSGQFNKVIIGKEGFFYLGNDYGYAPQRHSNKFEIEPRLSEVVALINQQNKFLAEKNTPFLFVVAPDKETIYPEHLPDWYHYVEDTFRNKFYRDLNKKNVNVLDLTDTLRLNKERLIYLLTDSHWNSYGGYLAYRKVMQSLDSKLAYYDDVPFQSYEGAQGDLMQMLKLQDKKKEINYYYTGTPGFESIQLNVCELDVSTFEGKNCYERANGVIFDNGKLIPLRIYSPEALNKAKLLWLRDSFASTYEMEMLATFSDTVLVHYLTLDYAQVMDLIDEYQPDYVVYQVVERQLDLLH